MNKPNSSDIFPFLNQEDIDNAVSSLDQQPIQTSAPIDTTAEQVQKQVPVIDNSTVKTQSPVIETPSQKDQSSPSSDSALSKSEQLLKMYRDMQGTSEKDIADARNRDIMLKLVGSLGDNLTTYLNAAGEKSAKTGAGVLAGKGGADFASKLATNAAEALANNKARQEALLKEYQEIAKGERQAAALNAKDKLAEEARKLEERRVAAYEAQVAKSGSKKEGLTPYQEIMLGEKQKKEAKLSDKQTAELEGLNNVIRSIDEVKLAKDNVNTGRYATVAQKGKDFLPFTESDQDFVKLRQLSGTQLFDYVKAQSGVSYSAKELAQLKENMPTVEDDDKTFITKLKTVEDIVKRKQSEKLKAFKAQGKNVEEFKPSQEESSPVILRKDPKSGRTVEYDAKTKKPIRFVD